METNSKYELPKSQTNMLLFECVFVLKIGILNFEIVSDFVLRILIEKMAEDI